MSVGRVEMSEGKKKYTPYASLGAEGGAESEYVYIERFIRTETLLSNWKTTIGYSLNSNTYIMSKMYNAVTGEYLGKPRFPSGDNKYVIQYVPLSFSVIPYTIVDGFNLGPEIQAAIGNDFFAYMGIDVNLLYGYFMFNNEKKLSECPLFTWYKTYANAYGLSTVNQDTFKADFQAFLFRAYLKKVDSDSCMYLDKTAKKLSDAEESMN